MARDCHYITDCWIPFTLDLCTLKLPKQSAGRIARLEGRSQFQYGSIYIENPLNTGGYTYSPHRTRWYIDFDVYIDSLRDTHIKTTHGQQ